MIPLRRKTSNSSYERLKQSVMHKVDHRAMQLETGGKRNSKLKKVTIVVVKVKILTSRRKWPRITNEIYRAVHTIRFREKS